jgi:hypothetical protein
VSGIGQPRVRQVRSFEELRSTRFADGVNALYWERTLPGDYAEVIAKLEPGEGIVPLDDERIRALNLTPAGRLAVEVMLADQQLLRDHDLAPSLNCVYDCVRSSDAGTVPTDVTSFHVDSAPVEVDTWLCTYYGTCSEGLRNEDALLKVEIPEIRAVLLKEYGGADDADSAADDACAHRRAVAHPDQRAVAQPDQRADAVADSHAVARSAFVLENIPSDRVTAQYLWRRGFRDGVVVAMSRPNNTYGGLCSNILLALRKIGYGSNHLVWSIATPERFYRAVDDLSLGWGIIFGSAGVTSKFYGS